MFIEDAVGETCGGDGLGEIVGVADGWRVAQGDGVLICLGGGFVLGFDHHGGASGGGYEHVSVLAWMGRKGLGVFGEDHAAGHHVAEDVAEGVVGVRFSLIGHGRVLRDVAVSDGSIANPNRRPTGGRDEAGGVGRGQREPRVRRSRNLHAVT